MVKILQLLLLCKAVGKEGVWAGGERGLGGFSSPPRPPNFSYHYSGPPIFDSGDNFDCNRVQSLHLLTLSTIAPTECCVAV